MFITVSTVLFAEKLNQIASNSRIPYYSPLDINNVCHTFLMAQFIKRVQHKNSQNTVCSKIYQAEDDKGALSSIPYFVHELFYNALSVMKKYVAAFIYCDEL